MQTMFSVREVTEKSRAIGTVRAVTKKQVKDEKSQYYLSIEKSLLGEVHLTGWDKTCTKQ